MRSCSAPAAARSARYSLVTALPLELGERVVDGRPDQGMDELERLLRPEHVDPDEGRDRLGGRVFIHAG